MIFDSECFRKQHWYFALLLIVLPLLSESCNRNSKTENKPDTEAESEPDSLPDDFVNFFDRFHGDSLYQMDHITFPLEGLPDALEADTNASGQRFFWQRAEWKLHHPFKDPSHQYENWFTILNERIIEHWVRLKGTNMVIRRRFARLGDEWHLIYYAGMRPYEEEE